MKYLLNKLLLASSCLALALAAPLPLLGMEPEEPVSIPVAASTHVQTPVQEDSWKDSLYEFPEIRSGFKINVFNKLLLHDDRFKDLKNQSALFECLEQSGFERRNPKALQCIKQYSTRPFLHINRVSSEKAKKADELLEECWGNEKNAQFNRLSTSEYLYQIGGQYQEGLAGKKKDPVKAGNFFFRSLELDPNTKTLIPLGILYSEGSPSIPQDQTIARLLWERAAADNPLNASINLSKLYWDAKNVSKAVECFKKASEKGDFISTINLADIYNRGEEGIEKDTATALHYFLEAYNNSGIDSTHKILCASNISVLYYTGVPGTSPDYRKAVQFALEADVYDSKNQCNLGIFYLDLKEYKNAYKWLNKAVAQYEPNALFYIAGLYYNGLGIKKNIMKARDYYKRSAKFSETKDHVKKSLYNYGVLVEDTDRNASRMYMLQAAEKGYSRAMIFLADRYLRIQTPDALAKAFFWIKKLQELNDPYAQALFEAATKRVQENQESSKEDDALVKCMESLTQADVVIESSSADFLSYPQEVVDSPGAVSASPQESSSSSGSSEDEETKPEAAEDYKITPEEIDQWKEEQAKWKEDIKNPKFVRERLQQAQKDFQNKQEIKERPPLSSAADKTIKKLRDKGSRSQITIDNLLSLFEDPYFQGQVDMFKTTDGYAIVVYNFTTGKTRSTGTHRKHNKSYKGLDANFLKNVAELVEEFMTPTGAQE